MKPFIEKLPRSENSSFVARSYRTPQFEVPWHQHVEHELILFTEGEGTAFVGNYVGPFQVGDIFFLGSELPHTFQKSRSDLVTSAVVVQFQADFWGKEFLDLPEAGRIGQLLESSSPGLRISGACRERLAPQMLALESQQGFSKVIGLCECLQTLSEYAPHEELSTHQMNQLPLRNKDRIEKIFQYCISNFQESIRLSQVAQIAGMSVPAFCSYFKKCTKKTFIDFLNEIRIGHACKLLSETRKTVLEICFESGFNTLANFNKQFMKMKSMTPSAYRKRNRNPNPGERLVVDGLPGNFFPAINR